MAIDRKKLINLRNNIQSYLDRAEREQSAPQLDEIINSFTAEKMDELQQQMDDKLNQLDFPHFDETRIVDAIENITFDFPDNSGEIVRAISNIRFPEINFPNSISVDNFPVQKYPIPPTNININGLRGPVKSTQLDVGDTITQLPDTNLENRRSIIVWNNSTDTVLWIGDSSVTVAIGIPVKPQNYSPALDLSTTVNLYGICDTGQTVDARILELSMVGVGA